MDKEKAQAFIDFFKEAGYDGETIKEVISSFIEGAPKKFSDEDSKALLALVDGGTDEGEDEGGDEDKEEDGSGEEAEFAHALGVPDDHSSLGD